MTYKRYTSTPIRGYWYIGTVYKRSGQIEYSTVYPSADHPTQQARPLTTSTQGALSQVPYEGVLHHSQWLYHN